MAQISAGSGGSQEKKCHFSRVDSQSGKVRKGWSELCNAATWAMTKVMPMEDQIWHCRGALEHHWAQLGASTRVPAGCHSCLLLSQDDDVSIGWFTGSKCQVEGHYRKEGSLSLSLWHFHFWWTIIGSSSIANIIIIINNKNNKKANVVQQEQWSSCTVDGWWQS